MSVHACMLLVMALGLVCLANDNGLDYPPSAHYIPVNYPYLNITDCQYFSQMTGSWPSGAGCIKLLITFLITIL